MIVSVFPSTSASTRVLISVNVTVSASFRVSARAGVRASLKFSASLRLELMVRSLAAITLTTRYRSSKNLGILFSFVNKTIL